MGLMNNGSLQSHVEEDDDFSSGYFDNPMSSLGGLDLDDSDPLSMAIGTGYAYIYIYMSVYI